MAENSKYIEEVYEFKGLWERPSKCGLRLIKKQKRVLAIATELYDGNPGTSITNWSAQLATELCLKHDSTPEDFTLIEHNPDKNSKLSFYDESFFQVDYQWDGARFVEPKWNNITKDKVDELIREMEP